MTDDMHWSEADLAAVERTAKLPLTFQLIAEVRRLRADQKRLCDTLRPFAIYKWVADVLREVEGG